MLSWELFYPATCQKACCFWQSSASLSEEKTSSPREPTSETSPCIEVLWEVHFLQIFENTQTQNFAFISYSIFTLFLDCQKKIAW